jgi:hypothetical protein
VFVPLEGLPEGVIGFEAVAGGADRDVAIAWVAGGGDG